MKYSFVVTGLALLVLANFLIVYQVMRREGFQAMSNMEASPNGPNVAAPPNTVANMAATMPRGNNILGGAISGATVREGFSSYLLS
jgi:hypothetical protein